MVSKYFTAFLTSITKCPKLCLALKNSVAVKGPTQSSVANSYAWSLFILHTWSQMYINQLHPSNDVITWNSTKHALLV